MELKSKHLAVVCYYHCLTLIDYALLIALFSYETEFRKKAEKHNFYLATIFTGCRSEINQLEVEWTDAAFTIYFELLPTRPVYNNKLT